MEKLGEKELTQSFDVTFRVNITSYRNSKESAEYVIDKAKRQYVNYLYPSIVSLHGTYYDILPTSAITIKEEVSHSTSTLNKLVSVIKRWISKWALNKKVTNKNK
jgi:hypothetical protein